MVKKMFFVASLMATSAAFGGEDFARWVDPFIGTAGTANCHPNACWPHGMVQAGPTSGTEEWKYCGGYQFADKELYGFVQDAISGTGCADLGDIRIQPFVGNGENERKTAEKGEEKASPGYYSVRYPKQGIRTEIAVSPHVAFYRFAFDGKKDAHLLVDLQWGHCGSSGLSRHVISCTTAFPDATTMTGSLHLRQWVERDCHFAIRFGRPPTGSRTVPRKNPREKGEWRELDFDLADGEPLLVKVAISRTSVAAALANLNAEVPHWDFAKTAGDAQAHLDAALEQTTNGRERLAVGAGAAAEFVMDGLRAIDRDADVGDAQIANPVGAGLVDERAVCREGDAQTFALGMLCERADVGAGERFAAREENDGHLERRQIVDDGERLRRGEHLLLTRSGGIAVGTGEVAGGRHIPHDDGPTMHALAVA